MWINRSGSLSQLLPLGAAVVIERSHSSRSMKPCAPAASALLAHRVQLRERGAQQCGVDLDAVGRHAGLWAQQVCARRLG